MAYIRTTILGTLGLTEQFTCTWNWGIFGIVSDTPDQTLVNNILAALQTGITASTVPAEFRNLLSTSGSIVGVRVQLMSEADKVLSVAEGPLSSAIPGINTPTKTPQDAVVISLRTETPGASGRGRWYWPALGELLSYPGFTLNNPTSAQISAAAKVWLNAIKDNIKTGMIPTSPTIAPVLSVRSIKNHINRDVVRLEVGNVLDTQRRRRNNIPETYDVVAFP